MAKRSKVTQYPPELRKWLDAELIRRGFGDYVQLAKDLKARGAEASKSGLQRYGSALENKLQAMRDSTEAAILMHKASPDDAGLLGAMTISMAQTGLFNVTLALKELDALEPDADPAKRVALLARVAKAAAELSRAGVSQKKHEIDLRGRGAAVIGEMAKAQGMTDKEARRWREKFLGIAQPPKE